MTGEPLLVVLGAGGQLGRALVEAAAASGSKVVSLARVQLDIRDADGLAALLADRRDSVVVNAAAWTDVDGAEDAEAEARAVNVHGAAAVASACAATGAALIHVSTDYVFSGDSDRPWRPSDPTAPANAYGRTKLEGERAVHQRLPGALIVRTSAIFAPWGRNFVTTMLRLGRERDRLRVVADQVSGPTSALDLARALVEAAPAVRHGTGGIVHYCGTPEVSWFGFARAVFEEAGGPTPIVEPIASADWPSRARRPAYSMLDTESFVAAFARAPMPWRASLAEVIARVRDGVAAKGIGRA